ncbi:ligand-gated channel [Cellvibrio zantedeschiae]|uniref:Ligand-gated channel n=1 Tax=Cellvibrio zantedeschiae TaxID=1237077 RepID=A0ABQ3B9G5_9GAMM|nr:TonB-dependent receptor [Cellvibrio zantedeschiae]GGY85723.1 ligand-gated channel [Cellvibrio zantedeschiae]
MNHFPKHYLAVVLAAACPIAFADDLEEVVVTASPFAKSIEAVNKPVNLLSGESLQNAAAATLGETLNGQLGVSSASFGPGVGLPIIRGQSDNRVKVMQDSVGSMDASAASPDHAVTLEPLLANKIEVLRGPAALRYGSGAIGGVVNVLDNRIPSELPESFAGGAELRNSSANNETVGVANLNAAAGNFAFHIDGVKRDSDNMETPGFAFKNPEDHADAAKGFIPNTDAKSTSGTLGASYISGEDFIGISVNKLDNNYGVPPDHNGNGDELVRIDMHQTRYDVKGELNNPFDGFQKISARLGHNDYQHTEMENGEPGTKFTNDAYEGRVELIHDPLELFNVNWNGAIGVQTAKSTFAAIGEEAFIPKSDISNLGIFIVEETKHNNFTYEIGVRADSQKITPDAQAAISKGHSISHDSINLSATTTWHFTQDQQFSLGIAQSQRAPSVEELLANGPHPATGSYLIGDENLNEETSTNIDFGYHWHGDKLQFSTSIFYNKVDDFIYAKNLNEIIDELNGYQYTQANATFKGFETELKIPFAQYWNLRLFSDKVRATLDDGGDLPRITPMRIGSSLDFNFNQWSANISATHTSKQNHAGDNESETDSYNRIDARIDYTFSSAGTDYTLFAKATNLTDAEIRNASSYLRDIAPEAGRSIQLGMRVKF